MQDEAVHVQSTEARPVKEALRDHRASGLLAGRLSSLAGGQVQLEPLLGAEARGGEDVTRFDLTCRLRMLKNQLQVGEIDALEYRHLRRGAALAYSEGKPTRKKARRAVQSALEAGELRRPEHCEGCEGAGPIEAHHPDYSKPLSVAWLCDSCHARADRELADKVPEKARA
jgi:hypothetical protein